MRLLRAKPAPQTLGARSEALAAAFLDSHGYRLIARNVRFPVGEVDIVAWDGPVLCFIEVRATSSEQWGGPLASITERKQRRILRAARWYLSRRPLPEEVRFDVVAITWSQPRPAIELIRNAFTADG
jgi:putative endonuclease